MQTRASTRKATGSGALPSVDLSVRPRPLPDNQKVSKASERAHISNDNKSLPEIKKDSEGSYSVNVSEAHLLLSDMNSDSEDCKSLNAGNIQLAITSHTTPHNLDNVRQTVVPGNTVTSDSATIESEHPFTLSAKETLKLRKKYHITPGQTPYPHHRSLTTEECKEVYTLLCDLHGEPKRARVLRASATVAGCGEVPELLDAILRTLLSQNTTFKNAGAALRGLIAAFPTTDNSPDWNAIRHAKPENVESALKSGGMQKKKAKAIKDILDAVYTKNKKYWAALNLETTVSEQSLLSLDYLHTLSDEKAMDALVQLPQIGVKTASCVMLFCMRRASFAVDTHVHRHVKWLGWVPENANEDKAFSHLEVEVPNDLKFGLHQLFIKHGQECIRCKGNTSPATPGWKDADCPIEHLVDRNLGLNKKRKASAALGSLAVPRQAKKTRVKKTATAISAAHGHGKVSSDPLTRN